MRIHAGSVLVMQIFHLVPNLNFGGLQKIVRLLAVGQLARGHSVTVGCWTNTSNHVEAERELSASGARVIYLRRASDGRLSYDKLSFFRSLKSELSGGKVDVLHVHNPFGYYFYGASAARLTGRVKVVQTLHATAMFENPRFGRKKRLIFWTAAMLSDAIVSVSSATQQSLRDRFALPGKKLFVVDNGIELGPFLAVSARQRGHEFVFGSAGRMSPEKNHRLLIEAFALLRQKREDVRLRLLGGGPLEFQLFELARRRGVSKDVEFCGYRDDVPAFLQELDVFVLPSDSEALGLSLIEAIAAGRPVIGTRVGGVPQVIENTGGGWLCPPKDTEALMLAMESAIASPGLPEEREHARRRVAERYSAERMIRDYEQVYSRCWSKP